MSPKVLTQRRKDAKAQEKRRDNLMGFALNSQSIGRLRALTAAWLSGFGLTVTHIRTVMRATGKEEVRRWVAKGNRIVEQDNKKTKKEKHEQRRTG